MEWKVVFNQDSLPSRPLHSIKSDTSSEMINRPELFLDSSLPQKKGNICFDSHRTPLYEYDFNHDFLCAWVKERVEIKNKTNKDQTKSTCPYEAHTRRTMAVKQMNPPKCQIFHKVWQLWNATLSSAHLLIIWRDFLSSPEGRSSLSVFTQLEAHTILQSKWQEAKTDSKPLNDERNKERTREREQASSFYSPSLPTNLMVYIFHHTSFPLS